MPHYQTLETEKYYVEANKHLEKRLQNALAMQNMLTFFYGLAIIGVTFYAIREMPNWLPAVMDFVDARATL